MLYEQLLPYHHLCGVAAPTNACMGPVARSLALLATTMSRFDDATEHFDQAMQVSSRMRSRSWTAHIQIDHTHMLLARGEPGDGEEARRLTSTALETAKEMGITFSAHQLQGVKVEA